MRYADNGMTLAKDSGVTMTVYGPKHARQSLRKGVSIKRNRSIDDDYPASQPLIVKLSNTNLVRSLLIGLTLLCFSASNAFAIESSLGFPHPEQDEPSILASWVQLDRRDAFIELSRPQLQLHIRNPSHEKVRVRFRARTVIDGRTRPVPIPPLLLASSEERTLRVTLPPGLTKDMRFSGKLTLSLDVESIKLNKRPLQQVSELPNDRHTGGSQRQHPKRHTESVNVALPTLYFHREGRHWLIYREDPLRDRFYAGNFRNTRLNTPDPFPLLHDDLALTGLSRIQPVLAFVHMATTSPTSGIPDDMLPPGSKQFCFGLDGGAFDDSGQDSPVVLAPPTEDYGLVGEFVPASRAWVTVGQLGAPLYTGFLDADGCTPFVIANNTDEISVAFFPLYLRTTVNIRGFVSDLNLGPQWPDSMPYFLFFFPPGNSLVTQVMLDEEEYVNTIYVAAANAMERARGGLSDVLYEFRLREQGDNSSTNAFYADEGHPQVRIKYSVAAREKFTIGHEYGHALHIAKLGPPLTTADLDYSVANGEPENQHTITSKEWQLTAAFEGFAHFVSALVWNEAVADDDALFRSGGEAFALDQFDRLFETNFDTNQFAHQGVELDWAQFFWNYHTDEHTTDGGDLTLAPSFGAIVDMWLASYTWPVQEGFFDDFRDGVETIVGTFGPANPVEEGLERFDDIAAAAGIDH